MALQGTIKDFALPDILQLIGIQRKTGILTLRNNDDQVTVKFHEGQVVGADTRSESVEDRLGNVLVRTGRITQAQLDEALEIQRETLQRLGHVLVNSGRIDSDELVEALNVQSMQIIYRLFRWREGTYHFQSVEDVEYDENHFTPVSSETILMEGARMIDEWPIIERRISSESMILCKTPAGEGLDTEIEDDLEEPELDFDLGFELDVAPGEAEEANEEEKAGTIELSPDERRVMSLVDGKRTVREICDLLPLGEFDTYRILADMMTRHLVECAEPVAETDHRPGRTNWTSRVLCWLCSATMILLAVGAVSSIPGNRWTPWKLLDRSPITERLKLYSSMARMERIEKAVKLHYLDARSFPLDLDALVAEGYADGSDARDPWGRPYQFQLSGGGYQLIGLDGEGALRPELTVSRRLNAVQQMMTPEVPDPTGP